MYQKSNIARTRSLVNKQSAADSFGRVWKVTIENEGEGISRDFFGMKLNFNIKKTAKPAPNDAQITLTNLSDESIALLIRGSRIFVYAGYRTSDSKNHGELVFFGRIKEALTNFTGADIITSIKAFDGQKELQNDGRASLTIKKGETYGDLLKNLMPVGLDTSAAEKVLGDLSEKIKKSKSIAGNKYKNLVKLSNSFGYNIMINNGELIAKQSDEFINTFKVDASHGLIGTPKIVPGDKPDDKARVEARMLLLGSVLPQDEIEITSWNAKEKKEKTIKVLIDAVSHAGDTSSSNWYTTIQGVTADA